MDTITLHVTGMHCKACTALVESDLREAPGITGVKASLRRHEVEITGAFSGDGVEELCRKLAPYVAPHGYALFPEKQVRAVAWREFLVALPVAAFFLGLFALVQKLGFVNGLDFSTVNYPMAFVIGVIASLSTCMAVVGGLTLSVSANFAKEGDKVLPQALFHGGRLLAFFVLGGVIGALGAEFQPGVDATFVLSLIVGLVMLVLGINLLDIFHVTKGFQLTLPRFVATHVMELKKINHTLTPALLGVATFFLPCGFTQSMQLYALKTADFMTGGLTMLSFALGTLPVLGALSFASLGIHGNKISGVFFKTSGLVVIAFAIMNIAAALTAAGLIRPIRF